MPQFTNTSWGRTRGPKNLGGPPGTKVGLSVAADLLGITETTAGYATENQRYLHVLLEDNHAGAPGSVVVYGYCHAFRRWFELPEGFTPSGANAAPTISTIVAPADTTEADPADHTPAQREYRTYQILGIDRVAFIASNANTNVYAACSTF